MVASLRRVSTCWKGQCDSMRVGKGIYCIHQTSPIPKEYGRFGDRCSVRRGKVNVWCSGGWQSGRRQVPYYLFSPLLSTCFCSVNCVCAIEHSSFNFRRCFLPASLVNQTPKILLTGFLSIFSLLSVNHVVKSSKHLENIM